MVSENNKFAISLFLNMSPGPTVTTRREPGALLDSGGRMFIFNRPFRTVAAGMGVVLLFIGADRLCQLPEARDDVSVAKTTPPLVREPPLAVSSAPVRDLSLSCRLPPAVFASWLPSLKSRIVPDQVAVRAPTNHAIFGMHSC
jgi:hypothetical protein